MYVFGGVLYPSETITSELWKLDLASLQWTPLFNESVPASDDGTNITERVEPLHPPVAVRGHTAHVVGGKMVVLLGMSPGSDTFPVYVQEYDFSKSACPL